jgi:hypothetical protein
MPELSNLLRQQLSGAQNGSQNSSSPHPDADTITAYVEQSLPTAERQTMAAHLAVCEPCREIVALSLPELELVPQTVIKPAPVSAWRRLFSPAFGLAASVAAMAIIAVLVLQLPHRTGQSPAPESQQAKVIVPVNQAPPSTPTQSQLAPAAGAPAFVDQTAQASPATNKASESKPVSPAALDHLQQAQIQLQLKDLKSRQRRDEPAAMQAADKSAAPPPVLTAGLQKKDYLNTNFFSNGDDTVVLDGQNNARQSQNVPAAPQPQTASAARVFSYNANTITNFSDIPANAASKSNTRLLTPTPGPERFSCTICKVVTATAHSLRSVAPTLRASNLGNSALGGPGMFSSTLERTQSSEVSAAPAKAEGGSLANSDSFSAGALGASSYKSSTEPTQWKVAGGKLIKSSGQAQWEDAYPAAAIEFSFVNARGKDIWAGGSNATLIHSHDSGSTWETVKLGDAATGSIVSIIAGTFNVQVKTSDNQLWSSSDGGKTWALNAN